VIDEDDLLISAGTAWVIFKLMEKGVLDEKSNFALGRNILKDKFGLILSIPAAGVSIKWFAKNVMNLKDDMELVGLINDHYKKVLDIKNNIMFYPYLTGAFSPDFDPEIKASFKNLEIGHNYIDMVKAIFEGICFQLKKIVIEMEKNNINFKKIKMAGGGSKSKVWPDILAAVINKDILIPIDQDGDFATKGAAIISGYGIGAFSSLKDGINKISTEYKVVRPKKNKDFYEKKFLDFLD
jgi:xylulokinase